MKVPSSCNKIIEHAEFQKNLADVHKYEGVYKVSGLAAWSKNCKQYSSLPLGAGVSLFCESVNMMLSDQTFGLSDSDVIFIFRSAHSP
jgi:hypothetical protein